jgi:homocysteine S-methyltransferase
MSYVQLKDFHRARLAILVDSKPDVIAFESFPSQLEADAVVDLLTEFPSATCWISFTCRDETHISEGTTLAAAVRSVAQSPQVLAVGVNCVAPRYVEPLLHAARQETDKPLVAYPNNGERYDAATGTWNDVIAGTEMDGAVMHDAVLNWYHAGARLIGGCCRTTPDTIRSIRAALSEIQKV